MSPQHIQASLAIRASRSALATALVDNAFERRPELADRYAGAGRRGAVEDADFYLSNLAQAIEVESTALLADYLAWAKVALVHRNVWAADLLFDVAGTADYLERALPPQAGRLAREYIDHAMGRFGAMPETIPSSIDEADLLAQGYLSELLRGEKKLATQHVLAAAEAGMPLARIHLEILQPVQREIGRLWQHNLVSVAQEHYCTAVTQYLMSVLLGRQAAVPANGRTLVVTCIAGDLHDMGARVIADSFELAGWNVFFIGANAPGRGVISTVLEQKADVLAISATMAPHVHEVRALVSAVRTLPECASLSIFVGGLPFTLIEGLWRRVGADGFAPDAAGAVAAASSLA